MAHTKSSRGIKKIKTSYDNHLRRRSSTQFDLGESACIKSLVFASYIRYQALYYSTWELSNGQHQIPQADFLRDLQIGR